MNKGRCFEEILLASILQLSCVFHPTWSEGVGEGWGGGGVGGYRGLCN